MFDAFRFKDKFDCWIEFEAKCLENIYLMKLHCALNEAQSLHSYRYLTKFSHFLTEKHYYKTAIISIFCISHNDIFFTKTLLKVLTIRAIFLFVFCCCFPHKRTLYRLENL